MGSGIAQLSIEAGFETVGRDVEGAAVEAAGARIAHFLGRKVEKGQLEAAARDGRLGRRRFRCRAPAGLVVSRVLIRLLNDGVRIVDEAGVTPEDLDRGLTLGAGWPLGPCALLDLVGIDVHVHASRVLSDRLPEARMAPPPRLVRMLEARTLGRKSGEGFFRY